MISQRSSSVGPFVRQCQLKSTIRQVSFRFALPLPPPQTRPYQATNRKNNPTVYLKGKPKYVNVYKQPKPTKQPVVKPTTVYHMPVYSP